MEYEWNSIPSSSLSLSSTSPVTSLMAPLTAQGSTSTFILTVASAIDPQRRQSQASVLVIIVSASAPLVNILTASARINANQMVSMAGNVTFSSKIGGFVWWSIDNPSVDLSKIALSPWQYEVKKGTIVNLVLAPNSFPPSATLSFTLCASVTINGQVLLTNASTTITVNSIPLPGYFDVTPPSGRELITPFSFTALNWQEEDLPLSFEFGFFLSAQLLSMIVNPRSLMSFASATLPGGAASNGFIIDGFVNVFDVYGANNSATSAVEVLKGEASSSRLQEIGSQILSTSTQPAQAQQLISTLTAVLNSVDCSDSPNCASLNRFPCANVANTCGSCLSGFLGESGESNQMCLSQASVATAGNGRSMNCKADSSCNPWQYCDPQARVCRAKPKQCAARGCSGHGSCVFQSAATGLSLTTCLEGDASCLASCSCLSGFFGTVCALNQTHLNSAQNLRATLTTGLGNLIHQQNVDAQSVQAWAHSLSAISAVPQELSPHTATALMVISQTIVDAAANVPGIALYLAPTICTVLDNVQFAAAGAARRSMLLSPPHLSTFVRSLGDVGRMVSSDLVPGQGTVTLLQSNFRMILLPPPTQAQAGSTHRSNITMPHSSADGLSAKPSTISMPGDFGRRNAINIISVKVIDFGYILRENYLKF